MTALDPSIRHQASDDAATALERGSVGRSKANARFTVLG